MKSKLQNIQCESNLLKEEPGSSDRYQTQKQTTASRLALARSFPGKREWEGVPQMGGNLLGKAEPDGSGGLCGSCPLNYLGQKGLPEEGA